MKLNIPNFTLISFSFLPIALISGPFLSDLIVVIIGSYSLFIIINNKLNIFNNRFFWIFFSFYFILIISSLLSHNILLSFESSLFYFRYFFFVLGIFFLLNYQYNLIRLFYYILVFSFILLLVDSTLIFFTKIGISNYIFNYESNSRISSFFLDENVLGSYLVRLLPIYLYLSVIIKFDYKYEKIIKIIIFLLVIINIIMSGERTAIFMLFLLLFTLLFFFKLKKNSLLTKLSLSFLVFVLIFSTVFINPELKNRLVYKTISQFGFENFRYNNEIKGNIDNDDNNKKQIYIFSFEHQSYYINAFKLFKDNFIIGIGPKLFREKCKVFIDNTELVGWYYYNCSTHPHNFYLQLLAETGVIGFLYLFLSLLYFLYILTKIQLSKDKRIFESKENLGVILIAGILINIFPFMPTGSFFNNWLNIFLWLPISFYIYNFKSLNLIYEKK